MGNGGDIGGILVWNLPRTWSWIWSRSESLLNLITCALPVSYKLHITGHVVYNQSFPKVLPTNTKLLSSPNQAGFIFPFPNRSYSVLWFASLKMLWVLLRFQYPSVLCLFSMLTGHFSHLLLSEIVGLLWSHIKPISWWSYRETFANQYGWVELFLLIKLSFSSSGLVSLLPV